MLTIIITIIIAGFIFDLVLDYLNIKNWSPIVPQSVSDIYSKEKYQKAREYVQVNYRFNLITASYSLILLLTALLTGFFGWLDQSIRTLSDSPVVIAILFFGIIGLASDLLSLPLSIYRTFVIEEKFGFNKTTPRTFIFDKIK